MTSGDTPRHPEAALEAYLDGLLSGDERAAFEQRVAEDDALRAEVERQREIDAALRRSMPVPEEAALRRIAIEATRAAAARAPRRHARARRTADRVVGRRSLALAASLALLVSGAMMIWNAIDQREPEDPYAPQSWRSMETVYADELARGFNPTVICKDDEEFAGWFSRRFGQGLALHPLVDDTTALGLAYANTISPATVVVLLDVAGEPVMLFVDRVEADERPELSAGSGLYLHRAEVGVLVTYELSPIGSPRALPSLYDPDAGDVRGRGAPGGE